MENDLSTSIVEAAAEVHHLLGGPGLMENIYEAALCHELSLRGIRTQRQCPIPVKYKNADIREPLYLDILVENSLVVEVKATEKDFPFYEAQLLTYLRFMSLQKGLLINFGKKQIMDGVIHLVNPLKDRAFHP